MFTEDNFPPPPNEPLPPLPSAPYSSVPRFPSVPLSNSLSLTNEINSYIYLIQDGEYLGTQVYKIGRTTQQGSDTRFLNRIQTYSYKTVQYLIIRVNTENVIQIEKEIINVFNNNYVLVKGYEWFEGNVNKMKKDILNVIEKMDIDNTVEQKNVMSPREIRFIRYGGFCTNPDTSESVRWYFLKHKYSGPLSLYPYDYPTALEINQKCKEIFDNYVEECKSKTLTWKHPNKGDMPDSSEMCKHMHICFKSIREYILQNKQIIDEEYLCIVPSSLQEYTMIANNMKYYLRYNPMEYTYKQDLKDILDRLGIYNKSSMYRDDLVKLVEDALKENPYQY